MHFTRLALFSVAGFCLGLGPLLDAQTPGPGAPPWSPDKQFSSDEVVSLKNGMSLAGKLYMDNGKIRTEMSMNKMGMIAIIRPDEQKILTVLPVQKMVMEMPVDAEKMKQVTLLAPGANSKFDFVGPDAILGTSCLKYRMTTDGKVFFWWVNATTNVPVKIASEDGSFSTTFTNYKAGPQDPALFEPPAGYQVMQMPAPAIPGGGAPDGGAPGGVVPPNGQ